MNNGRKPDFLIIGAQKCGTTWLWFNLKQHPSIDLMNDKEIQFFSNSKNYHKGLEWYYGLYKGCHPDKLVGEASTDYFYDHVLIDNVKIDDSLPTIPELIARELPQVKNFLILRDPVKRAVSAYYHHVQRRVFAPHMGLREAAEKYPRLRIIERGFYARFLKAWQLFTPPEQMQVLIFEEDVIKDPEASYRRCLSYLELDSSFVPKSMYNIRNKGWTWTHILLHYRLGAPYRYGYRILERTPFRPLLGKIDFHKRPPLEDEDIYYLKSLYLPEKQELESLLNRDLSCWSYTYKS